MSDESEHLIEQEEARIMMSVCLNKRDLKEARLRRAAELVIKEWEDGTLVSHPMIDALVRLREALE